MLDADIATLWDQFAYNAGFVVVRPTWYGRWYARFDERTRPHRMHIMCWAYTDRKPVWRAYSCGPKKPCIKMR